MRKKDKYQIRAISGVAILYFSLALIIYFTVKFQNPSFVETFTIVISLCTLVIVFETFEQAILSTIKWKSIVQFFLVGKELATSFFITLISLLIAAKLMELLIGNAILTKNMFNLLISLTFFISLFLYWLYLLINMTERLDHLYKRFIKTDLDSNISFKNRLNKKETINIIDLIAIFTTVFLLGNSTAAGITGNSNHSSIDFFETIEFRVLFIVMAVYVLAAYHKLPLKDNN